MLKKFFLIIFFMTVLFSCEKKLFNLMSLKSEYTNEEENILTKSTKFKDVFLQSIEFEGNNNTTISQDYKFYIEVNCPTSSYHQHIIIDNSKNYIRFKNKEKCSATFTKFTINSKEFLPSGNKLVLNIDSAGNLTSTYSFYNNYSHSFNEVSYIFSIIKDDYNHFIIKYILILY